MAPAIPGIHPVTAIAGDLQRNGDVYAGTLGPRLVTRTVNFDDPRTYHLSYGGELGWGQRSGRARDPRRPRRHPLGGGAGTDRRTPDGDPRLPARRRGGAPVRDAPEGDGPGAVVDLVRAAGFWPDADGVGTVHHVARRARDEEEQRIWRQMLAQAGEHPMPGLDRQYFRSISFRGSGGVLFEIATDAPGFVTDETPEALGPCL